MAAGAAAAMIGAAAIGAGGSIIGGQQAAKAGETSFSDIARGSLFRATGSTAVEEQLDLQALIQFGAPAQTIMENFIGGRIEETKSPAFRRTFDSKVGLIRSALGRGDTSSARQYVDGLNLWLGLWGKHWPGVGARGEIVNGELELTWLGPEAAQIEQYAQFADDIYQNRVQGYGSLAEIAGAPGYATPERFEAFRGGIRDDLRREIFAAEDEERRRIEQAANVGRYNPGGAIGRLGELTQRELLSAETDSITRALQLLGGQQQLTAGRLSNIQGALNPTLIQPALAAAGQTAATQNQIVAAQLTADQNTAAGGQGIASGAGGIADTMTLISLMNMQGGPAGGGGGGGSSWGFGW